MLAPFLVAHQQAIVQFAKTHDVSYLALFGSYARDQQKPGSDLDMLISFDKEKGLLDLIGVEQELGRILDVKVDLVTQQGLSKYIKPYIQDDLQLIYAKPAYAG